MRTQTFNLSACQRVLVPYDDPARGNREGTLERIVWRAYRNLPLFGIRFDDGTFLETERPFMEVES